MTPTCVVESVEFEQNRDGLATRIAGSLAGIRESNVAHQHCFARSRRSHHHQPVVLAQRSVNINQLSAVTTHRLERDIDFSHLQGARTEGNLEFLVLPQQRPAIPTKSDQPDRFITCEVVVCALGEPLEEAGKVLFDNVAQDIQAGQYRGGPTRRYVGFPPRGRGGIGHLVTIEHFDHCQPQGFSVFAE